MIGCGVSMTQWRSTGVLLAAALFASGCSVVDEKRQAYRASESSAPLQLPDALTPPATDNALVLPVLQGARPAADAPPFDTRPPAPANLPVEAKPETRE